MSRVLLVTRRLGVPAERCLKVGDSQYDVAAAREAVCGRPVIVDDAADELEADLLPHLGGLLCFVQLVF